MGQRIAILTEDDGDKTAELWCKHGIEDVRIDVDGHRFYIPQDILAEITGAHIRDAIVEGLEQMDGKEFMTRLTQLFVLKQI